MGNYRGNIDKVLADSPEIARRLRQTNVTIAELMAEYHCGFPIITEAGRRHIPLTEWKKLRHKRLARGGVKTRFQKGRAAWNKGLHFNAGGRSLQTRFKPGQIRGTAARKYRPAGTITVRYDRPPKRLRVRKRKEGMPPWRGKPRRWIKVKDTGAPRYCWIPYARYLWQQEHGPVPAGYFVVHKNGDQMSDVISNLILVDHKKHLALQMKRDPGHLVRLRAASGKAAKRRHETNRNIKQIYGPQRVSFLCRNCGADYQGRTPPHHCSKCGGGSFEKIRRRRAG